MNKAKNNEGIKGYVDANLAMIEQSQIKNSMENHVDVDRISEDPAFPNYAVSEKSKTAYGSATKADPDPEVFSEMSRFSKEHSVMPESEVKGTNSGKTPIFGKTDNPSD